jgi:hypothetical protein
MNIGRYKMNPNLERLAKETKNPGVKPELVKEPGKCLAMMIDCCGNLANYNHEIPKIVESAIDKAIAQSLFTEFTLFKFGNGSSYTDCSAYMEGLPLDEVSDQTLKKTLHKVIGGKGTLNFDNVRSWMKFWPSYKPHLLVIADDCCYWDLHSLYLQITDRFETGKFIQLGDGQKGNPFRRQYIDIGWNMDKFTEAVEDYVIELK